MKAQQIDSFALNLKDEVQHSVYDGSVSGYEKRTHSLTGDYDDPDLLRRTAGEIKQHTLENLDTYLLQAEAKLQENGAQVHWAKDGEAACRAVLKIMRDNNARKLVKSKSMATEEIHLTEFLEKNGIESLETDLGEFIIQIDHDHPSHIVKPIIHKNRRGIAKSFEREGLGAYDDQPEVITRRAREFLRHKYLEAPVGLTGGNFVVAESGRLVLVTNEGNSRFCLAATDIHIAVVGIEKLLPRDRDLSLLLNLLGRSGTGQQLTVYTEFISGPKFAGQPDGPKQMHVIFLDNQRSDVLATKCRDILRCIRCGACLNVCPIYRQASGHAYRSVYPGPVGAVLSPLLAGENFAKLADLPKASSLCGACNEVCPVNIPIPDLLLRLRDKAKREGVKSAGTPPMGAWSYLASQATVWRASLAAGKAMNYLPLELIPIPALRSWQKSRQLPAWRGGAFRKWMKQRASQQNLEDRLADPAQRNE